MMDSIVAWHPSLADEARSGSLRPLGVTPAAHRTRLAFAEFQLGFNQALQPGEVWASIHCGTQGRTFLNRGELGA